MKKFKKIYVEITNICNLSCSFCSIDNRVKEKITVDNFEQVLKKIDNYTDYLYLHVKGEPLLHPQLKELLDLCLKYNKQVNITTNGTLLKDKLDSINHPAIRQINISLHSENNKDNYLQEVFDTVNKLDNKIVVYRFWLLKDNNLNEKSTKIVESIKKYYELSPEIVDKLNKDKHIKIVNNIYVDKNIEFIWPDLDNNYYNDKGTCYALKDQIAILVDGTIVPCCLDSSGVINLGNIYKDNLEDVLNSKRVLRMKQGFCNRKVTEELCKHCSFKDRLEKNK